MRGRGGKFGKELGLSSLRTVGNSQSTGIMGLRWLSDRKSSDRKSTVGPTYTVMQSTVPTQKINHLTRTLSHTSQLKRHFCDKPGLLGS